MNERTHFFIKNIPLTFYSQKGWCWLCVRGELEMGTDCNILTQSSSDHSSTSSSSWLGLFNRVSLRATSPQSASWFSHRHLVPNWLQLQLELEQNWNLNWPKPSVAPGYIFVWRSPAYVRICTEFNHVHRLRWYSDIFDRMHLFRCSSTYLHRCISWLTARSRVSMLQETL